MNFIISVAAWLLMFLTYAVIITLGTLAVFMGLGILTFENIKEFFKEKKW
jgi:hypothetical protein